MGISNRLYGDYQILKWTNNYMSVCLSVCLSKFLHVFLILFVYLSICLSMYYIYIYIYLYLFQYLYVYSIYLYLYGMWWDMSSHKLGSDQRILGYDVWTTISWPGLQTLPSCWMHGKAMMPYFMNIQNYQPWNKVWTTGWQGFYHAHVLQGSQAYDSSMF